MLPNFGFVGPLIVLSFAYGLHLVAPQNADFGQSLFAVQLIVQMFALQVPLAQDEVAPGTQAPFALHAESARATPFAQLAPAPQSVPIVEWHATASLPSHEVGHAGSVVRQAGRDPCAAPFTETHCPSDPGTSHAPHWPAHALAQHVPSTHCPEAHVSLLVHGSPFG